MPSPPAPPTPFAAARFLQPPPPVKAGGDVATEEQEAGSRQSEAGAEVAGQQREGGGEWRRSRLSPAISPLAFIFPPRIPPHKATGYSTTNDPKLINRISA
jgi:hypothetical protein